VEDNPFEDIGTSAGPGNAFLGHVVGATLIGAEPNEKKKPFAFGILPHFFPSAARSAPISFAHRRLEAHPEPK